MNDLVTLKTYTYPHEAAVVKGHLESEGIECFLMDEITAQVSPIYSNAIGGVKLMVRANDFLNANEILIEAGITDVPNNNRSGIFSDLLDQTAKWKWLNNLQPELQVLVVVGVITTILMLIIYAVTQ